MNKKKWVALTSDRSGAVMAKITHRKPVTGKWVNDRWVINFVYVGGIEIARAVCQQVQALGPNPKIADAVAALQA